MFLLLLPLLFSYFSLSLEWREFQKGELNVQRELRRWDILEHNNALNDQQSFALLKQNPKEKPKALFKKRTSKKIKKASQPQKQRARFLHKFCVGIPQGGRLDLASALNSQRGREVLTSLIKILYKDQPFLRKDLDDDPQIIERLVDQLRVSWDEMINLVQNQSIDLCEFVDENWLLLLQFRSKHLEKLFQKMCIGKSNTASLRHFISAKWPQLSVKNCKVDPFIPVYLQWALDPLKQALLGQEVAQEFALQLQSIYNEDDSLKLQIPKENQDRNSSRYEVPLKRVISKASCKSALMKALKKTNKRLDDLPARRALRFDAKYPD